MQANENAAPTPLFGGSNNVLAMGTGFAGLTPVTGRGPLGGSTPAIGGSTSTPWVPPTPGGAGGGAASVAGRSTAAGTAAPLRDALNINRGDSDSVFNSELGDSASVRAAAAARGRLGGGGASIAGGFSSGSSSVALSLASLPRPRYAYEVVAPAASSSASDADDSGGGRSAGSSSAVLDEGELQAAREAEARREAELELQRRSAALRHVPALPRPLVIDDEAVAPPGGSAALAAGDFNLYADFLIRDEMLALLKADAYKYPVRMCSVRASTPVARGNSRCHGCMCFSRTATYVACGDL